MKKRFIVQVYHDHHYVTDVEFRRKWMAKLFHILLNRSVWSMGVREY